MQPELSRRSNCGRMLLKAHSALAVVLIAGTNVLFSVAAVQAQSLPISLGIGLGRGLIRSAARRRSSSSQADPSSDPNANGAHGSSNNGLNQGQGMPGYPMYSGYGNYPQGQQGNPGSSSNPSYPTGSTYPSNPSYPSGSNYPSNPSYPSGSNYQNNPSYPPGSGYPTSPNYPAAPVAANNAGHSNSKANASANRRAKSASVSVYNKSIKYFNAQNYEQAMPLLAQALQVDPRMGSAYALLAVCQSKSGRLTEAMQNFELAENFGNHYQTLLYEEGMCAARMRNYRVASSCLQEFVDKSHGETQTDEAQKALSILQHNFGNQPDGDYLAAASSAGQRRWASSSLPLHVYIQENPSLRGYHSEFSAIVKQAFDEWSQGSNGKVAFVYTTEASQAQIKVSWTDNEADLGTGDTKELGLTLTTFANGVIESADIKLHTLVGVCRDDASELFPQAKCVALHEIGHALGLQHSTEAYDTMYPLVPPKGFEYSLTKRDLNTVTALYSQNPAQITTMDTLKSLSHTELAAQKTK